jgi:hypothetical protein
MGVTVAVDVIVVTVAVMDAIADDTYSLIYS